MQNKGGWAVPEPNRNVSTGAVVAALNNIGLIKGEDFHPMGQGWPWAQDGDEALKRIIFVSDETFVMAKMILA